MDLPRQSRGTGRQGFALAPILYLIALAGIAGAVLFTGYTQILRSNVEITADNAARNQIRLASEVLSSRSLLNSGPPPYLSPPAALVMPSSGAELARLPKGSSGNPVSASALQGSAHDVGTLPTNGGVRAYDPWGRYYIYCRWESAQSPGTGNALSIISAGSDGKLQTGCGDTAPAANSDDRMEFFTVASVMSRAATWTNRGDNTFQFGLSNDPSTARVVVGVDSGADDASKQLNIGGSGKIGGDLTVGGNLAVAGVSTTGSLTGGAITGNSLAISGNGTIGGAFGVTGATTLGQLSAGASTLGATSASTLTTSGDATIGGALAVTGNTGLSGTLQVNGAAGFSNGITVNGTGDFSHLESHGGIHVSGYSQFDSDVGFGTKVTVNGPVVAAGDINSAATVSAPTGRFTNLVVTNPISGSVTGSAGSVDGGGITGVVPVSHGGTGATTAIDARANLGLIIGTNVQAQNATLQALANASTTGFIRYSGSGSLSIGPILPNEVPAFQGATSSAAGSLGGVPAPAAGQQSYVLSGAGTWIDASNLNTPQIVQGDSGVYVDDSGTGMIRFKIDGFEQARITGVANADRVIRITGGKAGSSYPNIGGAKTADGTSSAFTLNGSTVVDTTGIITSPGFVGPLTGNASTATKLATARLIGTSGDIAATATAFDGSVDITIPMTVAAIRGVTVVATAPTSGQALVYNGTAWAPGNLGGANLADGSVTGAKLTNPLYFTADASNNFAIGMAGSGTDVQKQAFRVNATASTGVINTIFFATGGADQAVISGGKFILNGEYRYGTAASNRRALYINTRNTAVGDSMNYVTGNFNTAVGYSALNGSLSGGNNGAFGDSALNSNTSGQANDGFGFGALKSNTTGSYNSGIGHYSLYSLGSGDNNTALGAYAGQSQTSGSGNIVIGSNQNLPSLTGSNQLNVGGAIYGDLSTGRIGLGLANSTLSYDLSLLGTAARTIGMERNSAVNTAGNSLTLQAGAATSGATDKNGGDLLIASGVATGTGSSNIYFYTSGAAATGTTDNSTSAKMAILGSGNVGIGTSAPLARLGVAGGIDLPWAYSTLANNTGGLRWMYGQSFDNAFGFVQAGGLYFQGDYTATNNHFGVRSAKADGSLGATVFDVNSVDGSTSIAGDVTLQRAHAVKWSDDYNSIRMDNVPTWYNINTLNNVMTFQTYAGGWVFRDSNKSQNVMVIEGNGVNKVGINTNDPGTMLSVAGGVQIGNEAGTCIAYREGTMRYTAALGYEACRNGAWVSLASAGGLGAGGSGGTLGTSATTANPAISGDATTGFYTAGAGLVDVTVGGVKKVEWSSTGESVTGIVNVTDAYKLGGINAYKAFGTNNLAIGNTAFAAGTAASTDNIAIGTDALKANASSGSKYNIAIGSQALSAADMFGSVAVGYNSLSGANTYNSVGIGSYAGNNGAYGVFVGAYAGNVDTYGYNTTAVGSGAGRYNQGGQNNTWIGARSGESSYPNYTSNNTALGYYAGGGVQTGGDNNIFVGYNAGSNLTTGANNIIIGYNVAALSTTASNQLNIGNTIYGDVSTGKIGIGATAPAEKLEVAGNIKLGDANTGTIRATKQVIIRQDGDQYGGSFLRMENRNDSNGFVVGTDGVGLVDFKFDIGTVNRNIRFETRDGQTLSGASEFEVGEPRNPGFVIGDTAALFRSRVGKVGVGIDTASAVTAMLDVAGPIRTRADTGSACATVGAGTIRWNGTAFQGCDGTNWTAFTLGSGSISLGAAANAASPSISGDPTTGFYTAGAGLVDVTIGGNKVVEWSSTGTAITGGLTTTNSVGIRASPIAALTVGDGSATDGMIIARGYGAVGTDGAALPISGAGTRMFWYPKKAAFRAGGTDSSNPNFPSAQQWNDNNIGNFSAAFGYNSYAAGFNSFAAAGAGVGAGTSNSAAFGSSAAYSNSSFAAGNYSGTSNGNGGNGGGSSIAMGDHAQTWGNTAVALGRLADATGDYSFAFGPAVTGGAYGGNGGNSSMAVGLGNASGAAPAVTGNNSAGFFLGDQSGANVAANNVFVVLGGQVGFGTAAPTAKLEVSSNPGGTGGGSYNSFALSNTYGAGNVKNQILFNGNGANKWTIGNDVTGSGQQDFYIYDAAANSARLLINSGGNVVIGSGSAVTKLAVGGGLLIGNETASCSSILAGAMRWNGTAFQGCDGTNWTALGSGGGSGVTNPLYFTADASNNFAIGMAGSGSDAQKQAIRVNAAASTGIINTITLATGGADQATLSGGNFIVNGEYRLGSAGSNVRAVYVQGRNTSVGPFSMANLTSGNYNTAVGNGSLQAITTGTNNSAVGDGALTSNSTGVNNTAVGFNALKVNTTGGGNVGVGDYSLSSLTGDGNNFNIALGSAAGISQTAGSYNIVIGYNQNLPSLTGSSQLNIGGVVYGNLSNGRIGLGSGNSALSYDLSLLGTAARTIGMERNTVANTAGYNLNLQAGAATSGSTNKAGGDLQLTAGTSTGSAGSNIRFYTSVAGTSGTADRAVSERMTISGNTVTLASNQNLVATGTSGATVGTLNFAGGGNAMFWNAKKGAFRAGAPDQYGAWSDSVVGVNSAAFGLGSNASGAQSFVAGVGSSAGGVAATALGQQTGANGAYTLTGGYQTGANGEGGTAIGGGVQADAYYDFAIGRFNVGGGNSNAQVLTDPAFEIGNGTDFNARANAFTVLKNGSTMIGGATPTTMLDVAGPIRTRSDTTSACATVGAGTIRWNGTVFQGCDGTNWAALGGGGGSASLGTAANAASPSISGDATTGFYTAGAGLVNVTVAGAKKVEWSSTGETVTGSLTATNAGTTSDTAAVIGSATDANTKSYGGYFTTNGGFYSAAVYGEAKNNGSGVVNTGGFFVANVVGTYGYGVNAVGSYAGISSQATGTYGFGGLFESIGTGSTGLQGKASATTGNSVAIKATASSTGSPYGLYAELTGANNTGYAGYFANSSATGWGVYSMGTSPNYFAGNIGVGSGTTVPTTTLDVSGPIRTRTDTASVCATVGAGAIRYNGTGFEGCDGTNWTALGTGGTGFHAAQGAPNNGDSSTNGYSFSSDGDTGMFANGSGSGAGTLSFYTNSVEAVNLTGNTMTVGAPGREGTVVIGGTGSLRFYSINNGSYMREFWGVHAVGDVNHPFQVENGSLLVGYAAGGENWGSNNMYVAGNVGIGANAANAKLDVTLDNGSIGNPAIRITNPNTTGQSMLDFVTNGTLQGRVRSDYVGTMNYVARAGHAFWVNGDTGSSQGTLAFQVRPDLTLSAASSIQLGNDTNSCVTAKAGAIRFNGTAFQGCDGTNWAALGGSGGGSGSLGTAVNAASPSISGDATTGFYTAGTGKVDVAVSGTKVAEWSGSGEYVAGNITASGQLISSTLTDGDAVVSLGPDIIQVNKPFSAETDYNDYALAAYSGATGNGYGAVHAEARGTSGATYAGYFSNSSTSSGATGVYSTITANSGYAVDAVNGGSGGIAIRGTVSVGTAAGIVGTTSSTTGGSVGIRGNANGATGATIGVQGNNSSTTDGAVAIKGSALGASGVTYAGYFSNSSTTVGATGIYSTISAYNGYAVDAQNAGSGGIGVRGTANSGIATGVLGATSSTNAGAAAIKGSATGTSGGTYGVLGTNASTAGYAVYGLASATSGTNYGVYGSAASPTGVGVYGVNSATVGIGVYGVNSGTTGIGIKGQADTGVATGVLGQTSSTTGNAVAVKGLATGTTGSTYAGYFSNASAAAGAAIYAINTATNNTGFAAYLNNNSSTGWNAYSAGSSPNYFAGNVGIGSGTTAPTTVLDVAGPIRTRSDTASACGTVGAGTIRWNGSAFQGCDGTNWTALGSGGSGSSSFGTSPSATSPSISGDATTGFYTSAAGTVDLAIGGIQTAEWTARSQTVFGVLYANSQVVTPTISLSTVAGRRGTPSVSVSATNSDTTDGSTVINATMSGTSGATYAGYFNTASAGAGAGIYAVNTGTNNTGFAAYFNNNSATGWNVYSGGSAPSYFAGKVGVGVTAPAEAIDVGSGNVRGGAFISTSDARLKHDIHTFDHGLDTVRKLRGVRFAWNKDGTPAIGLIAQEVEQVAPELVREDGQGMKAVMYANLVAPLIEAVKELADKLDDLGSKVAGLLDWQGKTDARLQQLEQKLDGVAAENARLKAENAQLQKSLNKIDALQARMDAIQGKGQ